MKPGLALALAVASGAAAVALVSVDLVFTLSFHLDEKEDGSWATLASFPYDESGFRGRPYYSFAECAGQDLRVRVDNNRPIPATVTVVVRHAGPTNNQMLYEETWSLSAFQERTHEFRVPDSAFPTATNDNPKPQVMAEVYMDEHMLSMCIQRGT